MQPAADNNAVLSSIYVLRDPRTQEVRYVGVTKLPGRRMWRHIDDARKGGKGHCQRWIATLLREGLEPTMEILEANVCRDREIFWIAQFRAQGALLTNLTDGGGGTTGYKQKPEIVEATRRRNTGRVQSEKTREAIAKALRGRPMSEEAKAKMSAAGKGKPKSEAMRKKLSASTKGKKKMSPDTKAKMSAIALQRGAGRKEPRDHLGKFLPHKA